MTRTGEVYRELVVESYSPTSGCAFATSQLETADSLSFSDGKR